MFFVLGIDSRSTHTISEETTHVPPNLYSGPGPGGSPAGGSLYRPGDRQRPTVSGRLSFLCRRRSDRPAQKQHPSVGKAVSAPGFRRQLPGDTGGHVLSGGQPCGPARARTGGQCRRGDPYLLPASFRAPFLPEQPNLYRRRHAARAAGSLFCAADRRRYGQNERRHLQHPACGCLDPADRRRQRFFVQPSAPQKRHCPHLGRESDRTGGFFACLRPGIWRDRPGRQPTGGQHGRAARRPPGHRSVYQLQGRGRQDRQFQHFGGDHRRVHGGCA